MTEDEMYDMITECVQARKKRKILQRFAPSENTWIETNIGIHLIIDAIVCDGCKFRVKPEPKIIRVRWYWIKSDDTYKLAYARGELCDEVGGKYYLGFHGWACDEQILTVPE